MTAYQIKINADNTPEQEALMSFQCNVQSVPTIEGDNIIFKSQVVEYNGKIRTEILITCFCSVNNLRMFNKINKLQKGNKLNVMGNLIKNDEEIMVSLVYIIYSNNASTFSSNDKKDLSRIPWLDQSGHKKTTNVNQFENTNNNLPKFILQHDDITNNNTETIEISDNNDDNNNVKGIESFFLNYLLNLKY